MRASASRLPLLMSCAYPARDDVRVPESTSAAGDRGAARHAILEDELRMRLDGRPLAAAPDEPAELEDSELFRRNAGAWLDALLSRAAAGHTLVERIFVLDVLSGRVRSSSHKRSHDDPHHKHDREIRCIADVVWMEPGSRRVFVDDYKTGQIRNVESAADNWQMRALGLAAARAHGVDSATVRVIAVDDDGRCRVASEATLEPWDLDEIAAALRDFAERVPTAQPTPGTWCRRKWCALAGLCPATVDVASKAIAPVLPAPPTEASYPIIATPLSPTHAAYLLVVLDLVKAFGAELEKNLKAYAKADPIPTGEGRTWGPVITPTTTIETSDAAVAVLSQALGAHVTNALGITKAGIERAAKLCTKRGEGAAKAREIMAALEAIGAVKQGNRTEYMETNTNG